MRFGDMNNITPIYAIFQLCNLQIKKKELVEVSKCVQIKQ